MKATPAQVSRYVNLAVARHPKSFMGFVPATFAHNPQLIRHLSGMGDFAGEQSTFSKVRKVVFLVVLTVAAVVAKIQIKKLEMYTATGALTGLGELVDLQNAVEISDANLIPIFAMYASGPLIQLLIGKDYPALTWAGLAGGLGYGLYTVGPSSLQAVTSAISLSKKAKSAKTLAGLIKKRRSK